MHLYVLEPDALNNVTDTWLIRYTERSQACRASKQAQSDTWPTFLNADGYLKSLPVPN